MFLGSFLVYIYAKIQNQIYGYVSTLISFLLPMILPHTQITIVIGRGLLAYAFIMIGILFRKLFIDESFNKFYLIFASIAITGLCAIINLKFNGNDYYSCIVNNPFTFVVGGITGTYLIISLTKYIAPTWSYIVGRHTLTIMGTHQLIIYTLSRFFPRISGDSMLWGFLVLVIITIVEIPVVYIIDRYLFFLTGRNIKVISLFPIAENNRLL